MARNTRTVSFSLDPDLVERIEARADQALGLNKSSRLQADLETYYSLLEYGLKQAQRVLTKAEAQAILDIQNSVGVESGRVAIYSANGGLEHRIQDAISMDGLAEKWGIDPAAIQAKLEGLRGAPTLALLDWAARMWTRHEDGEFWTDEINKFTD